MLLTEAVRLIARPQTIDLGETALPDMDATEHVHQLVADSLPTTFPPLRATAPMPIEPPRRTADERIADAERRFEERLEQQIAGFVERAFETPFRKRKAD